MPLYEFICQKCTHPFETLVRGDEKVACPECKSAKVEKQFSVPAAHVANGALSVRDAGAPMCGKPGCGPMGCGRG